MELKHDKNKGYRRKETPPFDLINRPLMAVQSSTALNAVSHSSTAIPPYVRNKKYSNCSSIKDYLNLKQVYLLNSLVLGLSFSCLSMLTSKKQSLVAGEGAEVEVSPEIDATASVNLPHNEKKTKMKRFLGGHVS